jgi:ADP-heptose:LPS heptosyltransferase
MTPSTLPLKIGLADIWRSAGGDRLKLIKTVDLVIGGALACVLPALPDQPVPREVRRILIIRPGGIGDAVFLLSIIEFLKEKRGLEIDILCERRNEEAFLLGEHFCRRIYCYDRWPELGQVLREKYDVVFDTEQWHYLSALVAYGVNCPVKVGFATRPLREKLFHVKVSYDLDAPELMNFKALCRGVAGADNINFVPGFLREGKAAKASGGAPRLGLFWGGSTPEKRLAFAQVISLADVLTEQGYELDLFGGADIREEARLVVSGLARPEWIRDLTGRASLKDTLGHLGHCAAFIGTDSGLLHLAAACGVPVAGIFGLGNEKKWGPTGARDLVITPRRDPADRTIFGYTFVSNPGRRLALDPGQEADVLAWVRKVTSSREGLNRDT